MEKHACLPAVLRGWLIIIAFVATPGLAQNLLTNGDFAVDVLGWGFTTPGTFSFNGALDADSNPASGSGQLANTSPVPFGTSFASQCINGMFGGNSYDFGARIRFDSGNLQTATGRANIVVNFFDGPNCSGNNLGGSTTANVLSSVTDVWTQAEVLGFVAPAGAVSVQVSLFTNKVEDTGTITINFDNVVFGPSGTLPAELIYFNVD